MAYDSARGVTVLYGGDLGDTWEWNGAIGSWTQRSTTGPEPRSGHAMAYDSARGVTVLFGGGPSGGYLADTWEWDGTTGIWTQRSTTGPSPRRYHAMVYDGARGVTVLFGGFYSGNLDDTWEYSAGDSDQDGAPDGQDNCPVVYNPDQLDTDHDMAGDACDQCPSTPVGEPVDPNGCSFCQRDADGDGVTNCNDQCPNTPVGEPPDANGCSCSQRDSDGDGANDCIDQCPNTPHGFPVDARGCPPPSDFDHDGDVDMDDFAQLQACLGMVPGDACVAADLNKTGSTVDHDDVDVFRGCMSGAGFPADTNCAN